MSRPILVVDDDESILATVAELLDMEGYQVQTAINGRDALSVLDRSEPSLVLLDMRMPVMDGWGFARALHERGRTVPILVMTAAQDARQWADEVGAAGFVAKPFDLPDLLDAIAHLTG
jgi:two-component system chemotaxis response regulator CheY